MTAQEFQRLVTGDRSEFLDRFLAVLGRLEVDYCIIGGLAVNAYAEPVVTLDCDVVVVTSRLGELETELRKQFKVESFSHSLNVSDAGSDLRVQIQTDSRYQEFLRAKQTKTVLGRELPVAACEDLLQGKIWAYSDETRRGSKRLKDLADIKRLIEVRPELAEKVPAGIRERLV